MIRLLAAGALLLTFLPTVARAQYDAPTGSRLGNRLRPGTMLPPAEAARGALKLAICIDAKRPGPVHAYLLSTDSKISLERVTNLQLDCASTLIGEAMSNEMSDTRQATIPDDILRGMLAEAELRRLHADLETLPVAPLQPSYSRPWFAITGRNVLVDEMGTCVVETNPAGVKAVLATEVASQGEIAAMAALNPNLGPCLRTGAKLQANRQSLRAALAEAMFQRIYAPPATPVGAIPSSGSK